MLTPFEIYISSFFVDTALIALLTVCAFYQYKRRTKFIMQLGWVFLLSFLMNTLSYFLIGPIRNLPGTIFDFVLVLVVGWLYNDQTSGRHKSFFIFCTVLYFIVGIYNVFFVQPLTISSYNKVIASFLIISYTIIYFYKLMKDLPERQVHRLPMFWFNSALLIFYAGTLILFAFTSYLINVLKNDLLYYMLFHNILSIIHHCIMFLGFRYDLKRLNRIESGVIHFR